MGMTCIEQLVTWHCARLRNKGTKRVDGTRRDPIDFWMRLQLHCHAAVARFNYALLDTSNRN